MAKTFKGFVPDEAVHFDLESPDGTRKVTFHCKKNVPGSKFLSYMETAEGAEDFASMARTTRDIINTALTEDSAREFWAFADLPDNGINLETLAEISGWLAETFSGEPPYGASVSLISWLAGDQWAVAAGEYAFYNGGAWLGDVPTPRLVEIAYWMIRRETVAAVVEKEVARGRERALARIDANLETAGDDDDTGLPSWVMASGIGPADGGSPFG